MGASGIRREALRRLTAAPWRRLLGQLIGQAGAADYGRGIQPGPVYYFGASAIGLDLRFGDPEADWRALEAIACGFEALGCALNPSASTSVTTRAS
jgi:hypothetical protein